MADNKQLTVKEFKMWLEGVEEMQEDGWTPSPIQWKRIRDKIECLNSAQPAQPVQAAPTTAIRREPSPIQVQEAPMGQVPTSTFPSHVPQARLAEGLPFATGDGKTPVKAPSIDTSDGTYRSPFGI